MYDHTEEDDSERWDYEQELRARAEMDGEEDYRDSQDAADAELAMAARFADECGF